MKTIKFYSKQILLATLFGLFIMAGSAGATGTETITASMEIAMDSELELEDWMINENLWKATDTNYDIAFVNEADESLELESWMTDENVWKTAIGAFTENEKDEELTLAAWMTEEEYWKL